MLGVVAYVLVPGERRNRSSRHFRRAGIEALKGVGALAKFGKPQESSEAGRRERIRID